MRKGFANRSPAVLAIVSAAMVILAMGARSQEMLPGTPVTSAPTDQTTAGEAQLEKVTVTGYLFPRIGEGSQPVTTLACPSQVPRSFSANAQPGSVIVMAIQAKVGVASAYRQRLT